MIDPSHPVLARVPCIPSLPYVNVGYCRIMPVVPYNCDSVVYAAMIKQAECVTHELDFHVLKTDGRHSKRHVTEWGTGLAFVSTSPYKRSIISTSEFLFI